MRDAVVQRLFLLFSSPDRAEALAGDLAEEREQRGWTWYWLHVVRITFLLWRAAATGAPLRVLALVSIGLLLLFASGFAGVAAAFLFPRWTDSPIGWFVLSIFWWGGALWTGASLVALAPRQGMAACATLGVVGAALLIGFAGPFCATGLIASIPLLIGAALRREQHS